MLLTGRLRLRHFVFIFLTIMMVNPVSISARDLSQVLDSLVPSLQELRKVQGVQIVVFRPGRTLTAEYGVQGPGLDAIEGETIFQAGELIQPVIAAMATDYACSIEPDCDPELNAFIEKASGVSADAPVKLSDLLTMTAGLEPSHRGLLRPGEDKEEMEGLIRKSVRFVKSPGTAYMPSSESYELVYRWLQSEGVDAVKQIRQLTSGTPDMPEKKPVAKGYTAAKHWPTEAPVMRPVYRSYHSLYTDAESYARFLQTIARKRAGNQKYLQRMYFLNPDLGGTGRGFHAVRLCENAPHDFLFVKYAKPAGYRSVAAVGQDGRGAVIFSNSEDMIFITTLFQRIFKDLYPECSGMFAYDSSALSDQETRILSEAEGVYRPSGTVPAEQSFFSFMLDNRLRKNDAGEFEFAGFFEKDPAIFLKPYSSDANVFRATGQAQMAGTLLSVEKDQEGSVIALQSDLVRYERIPLLSSVWGRIVLVSSGIVLIFLVILVWLIRRAKV